MHDDGAILEFRLPDLGEGLADAELVSWSVDVGDHVDLNQVIAEVETAKAVVALPSPYAGTVAELLAEPGETIPVGAALIRVRDEGAASAVGGTRNGGGPAEGTNGGAEGRNSVLVGYGPQGEFRSRRRGAAEPAAPSAAVDPVEGQRVLAVPAARKLAKELGVDLGPVTGSGPDGAVTVADVRAAVAAPTAPTAGEDAPVTGGPRSVPDTAAGQHGPRETRTPVTGVRKRTAAAMATSATIPQASTSLTVDCTATVEAVEHLRATPSFTGLPLTPLTFVAAAVLAALTEYPSVNAYFDEQAQEIVTEHYVNLGIAAATERGLLVPNVKDAQGMGLRALCTAIGRSIEAARSGTASPADLTGGTFTITNVGVFGVDTGIPLVNPGEAAILCVGAITRRPWVVDGELAVRWVATLSMSFDHRLVDGELAARFLATVGALLADPLALLAR